MSNSGKVKVQVGITKNLGNYENIKVDVGVEVDVDNVYDATEWEAAKKQIDDQLAEYLGEITSRVKGER